MDNKTGNILSPELMELLKRVPVETCKERFRREYENLREMHLLPTPEQQRRGRVAAAKSSTDNGRLIEEPYQCFWTRN